MANITAYSKNAAFTAPRVDGCHSKVILASRELLHRLMQKADVLNDNFEPGTMGNVREKSGIDPVSLIAPARRLVERHRSLVAVDGQRNGGLACGAGRLDLDHVVAHVVNILRRRRRHAGLRSSLRRAALRLVGWQRSALYLHWTGKFRGAARRGLPAIITITNRMACLEHAIYLL